MQMQAAPTPLHSTPPAPPATAAPAPSPAEDATVTKIAVAEFSAWQTGKIDASRYANPVPPAVIPQVQRGLSSIGTVKSVRYLGRNSVQGVTADQYLFSGEKGDAVESIVVQNGKIAFIWFAPAK